ncbi:MAG: hypothetical protein HYR63_01725 [Proteobacteria bacterium]|nr:hypothetical protein [Pseudomonadota bacterium]
MTRRSLLAFLAFLLPTTLLAHEHAGPHGGQAVDAGPYFVEFLAQNGQIMVFVYNDATEKPESMKAAKGTATVLLGQQREVAQLQPDPSEKDGHLLSGKIGLTPGPGMRVVVQLQIPGKPSIVARFAL